MLESYSFVHDLTFGELLSGPSGELLVCPPFWGGIFTLQKIEGFEDFCFKCWCQSVFLCFCLFSISHLYPLYFSNIQKPFFGNNVKKRCFIKHFQIRGL